MKELSSSELAEKMRENKILPHPKFKLGSNIQFPWGGTIALGIVKFIHWGNNDWNYTIENFSSDFKEKELQEFTDTTILYLP